RAGVHAVPAPDALHRAGQRAEVRRPERAAGAAEVEAEDLAQLALGEVDVLADEDDLAHARTQARQLHRHPARLARPADVPQDDRGLDLARALADRARQRDLAQEGLALPAADLDGAV